MLIHMWHAAKVDMSEYFRAKLSQFVLEMSSTIVQYTHNSGFPFEVGNSTISLPIYR